MLTDELLVRGETAHCPVEDCVWFVPRRMTGRYERHKETVHGES